MRIVFLGTPDFAIPTLEALIANDSMQVVAVVTQPDRASGRGQKLQAPPVKLVAQKHAIPVFQPEKLSKAKDVVEALRNLEPDLIIMVAFGQILKSDVLSIPKHGVINLHASLLPNYRGAAPINWAIINGDTTTGITTMYTEAGLDTGPMLLKQEIPIDINTNAHELGKQLAQVGAKLIIKTIEQLEKGSLKPQRQDDSKATYAPLMDKSTGKINWSGSASSIHNLVRGLIPWPLATTTFRGNPLKLWRTQLVSQDVLKELAQQNATPGTIVVHHKQLYVCCGNNDWLKILELQPMNKPRLAANDWINGTHLQIDEKLL